MKPTMIVTHNGTFHADEITAIALLHIFKEVPITNIVRTRDVNQIALADYAVDVGGLWDEYGQLFDHHQFNKDHKLYGLSSAGLVAKFLRLDPMYKAITELVSDVDNQDKGVAKQDQFHFCNIISSYNIEDIYSVEQDMAFLSALDFTIRYIANLRNKAEAYQEKLAIAEANPAKGIHRIVVLPKGTPYVSTSFYVGKADVLVTYDDNQDCWTVQMVPLSKDNYGSKYTLLPTGENEEIFCHKAGFITKVKETSGAIALKMDGKPVLIEV